MATYIREGNSEEIFPKYDLDTLQALVDGYIEFVRFPDGSAFMVNEEGIMRGMPLNVVASRLAAVKGVPVSLCGPVVFFSRAEMQAMSDDE